MENKPTPIFVDGLIFSDPHTAAPDWVKFNLSVHGKKFLDFLVANKAHISEKGWFKIVAKVSKRNNSIYFELDTYKPQPKPASIAEPKEDTGTTKYTDENGNELEIPF